MTKKHVDNLGELNVIIERLSSENAHWRKKVEEVEVVIRQRAPAATNLSLKGAICTIIDERDQNIKKIDEYRNELKKILRLLLSDKVEDAKKQLNLYLFNDKK